MSSILSDTDLFEGLLENPLCPTRDQILGSVRLLTRVKNGDEVGPKTSILIEFFNTFTQEEIKDYVYQRMTKPVLVELALKLCKEFESKPGKNDELEVVLTSEGTHSNRIGAQELLRARGVPRELRQQLGDWMSESS